MHLITGSTGNIGRNLVELLVAQAQDVRALVLDRADAHVLPDGIDVVVGNLDDVETVSAALSDVDAVFLLHAGQGTRQTQIMIDAARGAEVQRIVLLSSFGARQRPPPALAATLAAREDLLRESGLDVTFLRPNTLMSNALWWIDDIRNNNRVFDPTGPGRMPCIDPADVARVAAQVLTQQGHIGRGYLLNGPEALTSREQVEILADVLGRPIEFVDVTPEEFARYQIAHGMRREIAEQMQELNEMFRAGRAGVISDEFQNLTGLAPHTFRDWCERHYDSFR